MRIWTGIQLLVSLLIICPTANAEIIGSAPVGFQIEITAETAASPSVVYQAIIKDIDKWWDPAHSYSGKAENLYFDSGADGCFGERLPDGGFVRHLELVHLETDRTVRLTGGLGPLQEMGVDGALTIHLEPTDAGTEIRLNYNVSGYALAGLDLIAPAVDRVLDEQLSGLQTYAENAAR